MVILDRERMCPKGTSQTKFTISAGGIVGMEKSSLSEGQAQAQLERRGVRRRVSGGLGVDGFGGGIRSVDKLRRRRHVMDSVISTPKRHGHGSTKAASSSA